MRSSSHSSTFNSSWPLPRRYIFWATLASSSSLSKLLYTNQVAVTTFVPSQRIPDASLCSVRSATTISWAEHWDEDGDNRDRVADKTLLYPSSSSSSSWLSPCPGATVLEETGAPSRVPETRVMQFPITLTASLFHEDDEDGYDNWIRRNMADTLFRTHNY